MLRDLEAAFRIYAQAQARRVLTQLDRDPHSPTYGCFDRAYWHYKTADFASGVLQQAMELLEALRTGLIDVAGPEPRWEGWAVAAVNALSRQAGRSGTVDEYYPHEDSYPGAAFALWAAVRLLRSWEADCPALTERIEWSGLRRGFMRLSRRSETGAANQYAAGVAALALAAGIERLGVSSTVVERHAARLLALQHPEGWFEEYGGPDTAYLTVTLDALADYWRATNDPRAAAAIERAVGFLASLVAPDGKLPWTLNSRNTNYVLPYGLVYAAQSNPVAAWLVATLFAGISEPSHWMWSADDRYHCHYLYASVLRSLPYLSSMTAPKPPDWPQRLWLAGCGYWVVRSPDGRQALYVAARKGGSLRLHTAGRMARFDHGWRLRRRRGFWVTDWWSPHWRIRLEGETLLIEGPTQGCAFHRNTPWRQLALRLTGRLLGRRLAPLLERILIRRGRPRGPWFRREIRATEAGFEVRDRIEARTGELLLAPRQNLRHVASSGWFDPEELAPPLSEGRFEFEVRWGETA